MAPQQFIVQSSEMLHGASTTDVRSGFDCLALVVDANRALPSTPIVAMARGSVSRRLDRPVFFLLVAATALFAGASCADPTSPRGPAIDVVRPEWVTGAAALALGPNGQFRFSYAPTPGEVDSAGAIALADVYVSSVILSPLSGMLRRNMEILRKTTIDWPSLKRCRSLTRAEAVIGPVPDSVDRVLQRYIASRWLVPYCESSGAQSVMIDVSVRATDVHAGTSGLIFDSTEVVRGSELSAYPQPGEGTGLFLSPEIAVAQAFAFSGRRAIDVPLPVVRGTTSGALFVAAASRWIVTLEDSIEVVAEPSGRRLFVRELWMARDSAYQPIAMTPSAVQPPSVPVYAAFGNPTSPTYVLIQVPLRRPVLFEKLVRP